MNKKVKGGLAAALGVALLAGGSTLALWSDSATVAGDQITSGNLDVAAVGAAAFDISADRVDHDQDVDTPSGAKGHAIDTSTWRMVPGDTVELTYAIDVGLEGDNLVAELSAETLENSLNTAGVTVDSVRLFRPDGTEITATDATGARARAVFHLQAAGAGQAAGVDDPNVAIIDQTATDGTPDVHAVVQVSFDADNQDQVQASLYQAATAGVTLKQIRQAPGAFNATP